MAVTVTQVGRRTVFGDRRVGFYTVAFSGSYATGGEAVTPGLFGLNDIDMMQTEVAVATSTLLANPISYNAATSKIQMWESGGANGSLIEKQVEAYDAGDTATVMVIGH